jgi:hypothetical protein
LKKRFLCGPCSGYTTRTRSQLWKPKYSYIRFLAFILGISIHHFPTCCTRYVAYQNVMPMKTSVKQTVYVFYNKATSQIGTNVRTRVLNTGLLARSHFASGRSCDRPTRSRFSVVFLGPRANAELVPTFHVALHASHAALEILTFQNFAII